MKHKIILSALCLVLPLAGEPGAKCSLWLADIATNSKSIAAARRLVEVSKAEASAGLLPPNPEIAYEQEGGPAMPYAEVSVTQSFDFPLAYWYRSRITGLTRRQADEEFLVTRLAIFSEASSLYIEAVELNRRMTILKVREGMVTQLLAGLEKRLQVGETNALEAGRIRAEMAKLRTQRRQFENRLATLTADIKVLNGGVPLAVSDTAYPLHPVLPPIDTLIQAILSRHPETHLLENRLQMSEKRVALKKSLSFPRIEASYRKSVTPGEPFSGFRIGAALPIFENRNNIRAAAAHRDFLKEETAAKNLDLQNRITRLIKDFHTARQSAEEFEAVYSVLNAPVLLLKAYSTGHIGYTNFFLEYDHYFQTAMYYEELLKNANLLATHLFLLSE
jgi:hypothetical protein